MTMRWTPDKTGRFPSRPFYTNQELDNEGEQIVESFLKAKYGQITYPITTNDLLILLENHINDLDVYADLSSEGVNVEGLTDFFVDGRIEVRIDRHLSENPRQENRYRTTLSHEFGHVKFHRDLFNQMSQQLALSSELIHKQSPRCKRDSMLNASQVNWMEWQAGYVSGAILMPITALSAVVTEFREQAGLLTLIYVNSPAGQELIQRVQKSFQVSADAARVRLLQLKYLSETMAPPSLFDLLTP